MGFTKHRGQNLAEMSLVVSLLSVLCIFLLSSSGSILRGFYGNVTQNLSTPFSQAAQPLPSLTQNNGLPLTPVTPHASEE